MIKFRKPILILGMGLSLGLGFWDILQHSPLGDYSVLGAMAVGGIFWSLRKNSQAKFDPPMSSTIDQKAVMEEIAKTEKTINYLEKEAPEQEIGNLKEEINIIKKSLERENLAIAIIGNKRVGKSSLTAILAKQNKDQNISYFDREEAHSTDDLVIFLVNGDLTASEAQIIGKSRDFQQRMVVTLNKQEQYNLEERSEILQKIRTSLREIIGQEDIMSISAAPKAIKVKKHLPDGRIVEELEEQKPELKVLNNRLTDIIKNEKQQLILASTWRKAKLLEKQAKNSLNKIRNNRSQPIIEQYQWMAATAAFANPVSALDLLATAAINGQMLVDLGEIYQQKMTLEQAQNAAVTIGKVMVKLGLIELSSQAISGILKSNAITYIVGGIVQGISAAYLTRIAGLSVIAYYEEQEISNNTGAKLNLDKLTDKIKAIFTDNQKANLLQNFVIQTLNNKQLKLTN